MNNKSFLKTDTCFHTPSKKKTFFSRFIDFFLHKNKLCKLSAKPVHCSICEATISFPEEIDKPIFLVSYYFYSFVMLYLIGKCCVLIKNSAFLLSDFVAFILILSAPILFIWLFDRVLSALILSRYCWKKDKERVLKSAKSTNTTKSTNIFSGLIVATFLLLGNQIELIVLFAMVTDIIVMIVKKKAKYIALPCIILLYSLVSLFVIQKSQIDSIKTIDNFVLSVLLGIALFQNLKIFPRQNR